MIDLDRAIGEAARRYATSGRAAELAARAKLRLDPIYGALLARGLTDAACIVDLGCGRGLMLALLLSVRREIATARALCGIERSASAARVARAALREDATILEADLGSAEVPAADAVLLLDVLHYLDAPTQEALLDRAVRSLRPGGRIFVREADAGGGARFLAVRLSERLMALGRGEGLRPFRYRTSSGWRESLAKRGLSVEVEPMGAGTPFANVLLVGRAPGPSGA